MNGKQDDETKITLAVILILVVLALVAIVLSVSGCGPIQGWVMDTARLAAAEAVKGAKEELVRPPPSFVESHGIDLGAIAGLAWLYYDRKRGQRKGAYANNGKETAA